MYDFIFICPLCNKTGFEYKVMPKKGDTLRSDMAYLPKNGIRPNNSSRVICDNCDQEIPLEHLVSERISKK